MYSIGDFSEKTGISISCLRYYDKENVLIPNYKAANGYRYYTKDQIINALFINNMKALDLPLDIIKELSGATDAFDMHEKISKQKNLLQRAINQLDFFEKTYLDASKNLIVFAQGKNEIKEDILAGCGYICEGFINNHPDIRDFVAELEMKLLIECYKDNLNQNKCMRIICKSLSKSVNDKKEKDLAEDILVVPVEKYYNKMNSKKAGVMADQKTLSTIFVGTKLDFMKPVEELRQYAMEHNIKVKDTPIVDILCGPGDIPVSTSFISKVHLLLK